jgi:hypothetical protein
MQHMFQTIEASQRGCIALPLALDEHLPVDNFARHQQHCTAQGQRWQLEKL